MGLPTSTIKKLFREHFQAAQPWLVADLEREALVADHHPACRRAARREHGSPALLCLGTRAGPPCVLYRPEAAGESVFYRGTSFRLLLNDQGALTIQHDVYRQVTDTALVASVEQLLGFLMACREALERQEALASKRQKVRDLKAQAIVAQVKKLAREEQFDFYTKTDTVKLTLYVKIADDTSLELQIAFKDFARPCPIYAPLYCCTRLASARDYI